MLILRSVDESRNLVGGGIHSELVPENKYFVPRDHDQNEWDGDVCSDEQQTWTHPEVSPSICPPSSPRTCSTADNLLEAS